MTSLRFMAMLFAALATPFLVQAAPPVFKCSINGSTTYQSQACPSSQPRVHPTPAQLNAEQKKRQSRGVDPAAALPSQASAGPAEAKSRYACDGRTHCNQMTSCAEAKYFLANCPNVKMDGDHDGIPCEQQWCH